MRKIEYCRECGINNRMKINRVITKHPFRYFVSCDNCFYCGKTKLTINGAIKAWNKEQKSLDKIN